MTLTADLSSTSGGNTTALDATGRLFDDRVRSITFPPRDEPFGFRQALERKYRDDLRRSPTSTYVDIEGSIVWTQEYLRYRVNGCGHSVAESKVLSQIRGRGIAPVCSSEELPFPPRNEPFDFRNRLEALYRDELRRSPGETYVDIEGDIVWTQEYLRYRVSGCGHAEAQRKVFDQIDGRGVQPACVPEGTFTGTHSRGGSVRIEVSGTRVRRITLRDIDVNAGTCRGRIAELSATNVPISDGRFSVSGTVFERGFTFRLTIEGRFVNADSVEGSADVFITGVCVASLDLTYTAKR